MRTLALLLPRLMVLTPRPCARLAVPRRLSTAAPRAQFDADPFGAGPQPPTEKQFAYAQTLAMQALARAPLRAC